MSAPTIFCPGGPDSQTGDAVKRRYPKARIATCGDNISDVPSLLRTHSGPFVIPMWNSHHGEIGAANFVWDQIQTSDIELSDLWAKSIEFWFVARRGENNNHPEIGSVPVAKSQCSGFLRRNNATLKPYKLTTVAFTEYRKGAQLRGVLVAPGQGGNEANFEVLAKQTANPNNFTSFVSLAPVRNGKRSKKENSRLTGVTMRPLDVSLGAAEQSFFAEILRQSKTLDEIPKLIFVLKRTAKIGLLFEGPQLYASDLLDAEDVEQGDVQIHDDAGSIQTPYTTELYKLFIKQFPSLHDGDFVLHCGAAGPCLFACPALGLYTHGYEIATIEPVFRFYVSRLFQHWNNGDLQCTESQSKFFNRYREAWQKEGVKFIKFKTIAAEA